MSALLVVKAGTTLPEISQRRGDFEDWIAAGMKIPPRYMRVVRAFEAEPLPDPFLPALAMVLLPGPTDQSLAMIASVISIVVEAPREIDCGPPGSFFMS